jgi:predicted nucleotidyltransferase
MAETKIYIPDKLDRYLRERAMERFGYRKGAISEAAEEAISQWIAKEEMIGERIKAIAEQARHDDNVIALLLFGSYARKEPAYRDVDIAIVFRGKPKSSALLEYTRHADGILDISAFNTMPINMQARVIDEAVLLYLGDKESFYNLTISISREWNDFKPTFDYILSR